MQKVKFSGEFDLGCLGKNAGVNRHLTNRLKLEKNVLLIGENKHFHRVFKKHDLITRKKETKS